MQNVEVMVVFVIYLVAVVAIGIWTAGQAKTLAGFLIAERNVGPWVTAMTHEATAHSAYVTLSIPGRGFSAGLNNIWLTIGPMWKEFEDFIILGRRMRLMSERLGVMTVPDFLEFRYQDRTRSLRVLSAIVMTIFLIFYSVAQFTGGGRALQQVTGLDYRWSATLASIAIILYCVLGGYFAVVWTDFFQGLVIAVGMVWITTSALIATGGFGGMIAKLQTTAPKVLDPMLPLPAIIGFLTIGVVFIGTPQMTVRLFSIKRGYNTLRTAALVGFFWAALIFYTGTVIGLAGKVLVPGLKDPEMVIVQLSLLLTHPIVAGIVLAAVFAAIMSTVDSCLLVVATAWARDVYQEIINPSISEQRMIAYIRLALVVAGVVSLLIAVFVPPATIFWLLIFAWGGSAAFLAPVVLGCFWKAATWQGAFAGIAAHAVVLIIWKVAGLSGFMYELFPAVVAGFLFMIVVSLLTPGSRPSEAITSLMDEFKPRRGPAMAPGMASFKASELRTVKDFVLARGVV